MSYKGYFDIKYMIETAKREEIPFVVAVSEDKYRGAGKTYSAGRYFFEHFIETGERVCVFVREVKELGLIAQGIFGKYITDNHPNGQIYEKTENKIFNMIYYKEKNEEDEDDIQCLGVVIPLKNAKNVKSYRGLLQSINITSFYMDEFMPLDGKYLTNETDLMKTIIDTINGDILYMPVVMTANTLSLGNPYFTMLGLNNKIQIPSERNGWHGTKRYKSDVVIYENVQVDGLDEKHMNSPLNRAFKKQGDNYANNAWIADNNSLVCKPDGWGHGRYMYTLIYKGEQYGVHAYYGVGLMYVSKNIEKNCEYIYNVTPEGDLSIPLLKTSPVLQNLRKEFYAGHVRCKDGTIQNNLMTIFA